MPKISRLKEADSCCPIDVVFPDEEPLSDKRSLELEDLFKILANDTRLRILHTLALTREICVCDLSEAVGMKTQAVSNQLQRLHDRGMVTTRRSGNNVYYSAANACVLELLKLGICLLIDTEGKVLSVK